jgi:hypothetical protein
MVGGMGGGAGGPPADTPQVDTAEQIYISSLALLKMLKHGGRLRWAGSAAQRLHAAAPPPPAAPRRGIDAQRLAISHPCSAPRQRCPSSPSIPCPGP